MANTVTNNISNGDEVTIPINGAVKKQLDDGKVLVDCGDVEIISDTEEITQK